MPVHSTCEFWDQNNNSGMDHITNQALPRLSSHGPHCYWGYDFWVVTELLTEPHFVLLRKKKLYLLSVMITGELPRITQTNKHA